MRASQRVWGTHRPAVKPRRPQKHQRQPQERDADTDADTDAQESPSVIRMKLFALLSTKSDLKQPMCMECANMALDLLTNEFDDLKRERDAYISFEGVAETLKKDLEGHSDDQLIEKEIERVSGVL